MYGGQDNPCSDIYLHHSLCIFRHMLKNKIYGEARNGERQTFCTFSEDVYILYILWVQGVAWGGEDTLPRQYPH